MSDDDDGTLFPDDWNPGTGCLVAGSILAFWGIVLWAIIWWLNSV